MFLFRRTALLLALALPALSAVQAHSTDSSSAAGAAVAEPSPSQAQQPAAGKTPSQLSVQARIRARREQRRLAAIHDAYSHVYEGYVGGGYLRTYAGPSLQKVTEYNWNVGFTRYYSQRLGVTLDGRGNYGTAFTGLNLTSLTRPAISQYSAMIGPSYRFYLQPKFAVSGRVLAGFSSGNFSADTNGFGTKVLGLFPDGMTYAASAALIGEYNVTPNTAIRLAPEYYATGFGSQAQNSLGFTAGVVYRFGKK
jgi:hypothetical protein